MKHFSIILFFILTILPLNTYAQDKDTVYVMEIKQNIDKSSMRKMNLGIKEAISKGADYIVLDINTYGGAVDAADSMRTALIQCPIPTIAFINPQAASAGALISIACDSIYMRQGSSIGAATVVDQSGKVMPDKYQSFMRGMMRSTAESHGKEKNGEWHRDPKIAQQMTDTANVLTLTADEAIACNYCEGKAESVEEVVAALNLSETPVVIEQSLSFLDRLILFLLSPVLQGIFLMMIIGGIYFELQSPGIGFPLAAAILGALLYFAPLYIAGLAMYWEIAVFIIGVALLVVEIFVTPGFGVAGISGILLIVGSLVFAMIDNGLFYYDGKFDFSIVVKPTAIVLISCFLGTILSIWAASKLFPKKSFSFISLKTELKDNEGWVGVETDSLAGFVGMECEARTDMHPSGKLQINGKLYEASLEFGSAVKGDKVKVVRFEGGRLYCEKV